MITTVFKKTPAQITNNDHLIESEGDTWTLQIGYDVPNLTQRHSLYLNLAGSMKVFVANPSHATPLIYDSINFPSATGQTLQPVYPPAGTLPTIPVAAIPAPVRATLGPVANHQPALIATGNSASSALPAGGNSDVILTFRNQGTAASTSLTYSASGFPPNAAVTNCIYIITPLGTSANAACSVDGNGELTFCIAGAAQLPAGVSIQIKYTVPIPANTPPNPASYSFAHRLLGSNGILPLPAAVGTENPVVGVLAGGAA